VLVILPSISFFTALLLSAACADPPTVANAAPAAIAAVAPNASRRVIAFSILSLMIVPAPDIRFNTNVQLITGGARTMHSGNHKIHIS
jgi:uncharacterized lipoprotein YajG